MPIKLLHEYHQLEDEALAERGLNVAGLLDAGTFTITTTVTSVLLKGKAQGLVDSIATSRNGTPTDTLNKKKIRADLIALMDTLANDVENAANAAGNPAIVTAFGFMLATGARTTNAPGPTAILGVTNLDTGKLGVALQRDRNAWCYLIEDTQLPNGPVKIYTFTDPANAVLPSLVSGSMHSLRACTMAAKNQTGPWSDPVQHMST